MQYLLTISLLLATAASAIPAPGSRHPHKSHDHSQLELSVDSALVSRLEKLFEDPYSYPGAPERTESYVSRRQSTDTRNDVVNGLCNDIIVVFARGTTSGLPFPLGFWW
jgi:hypothetical protein